MKSNGFADKLKDFIKKHDISDFFSSRLEKLQECKVVFVFDDSGSMKRRLEDSPLKDFNNSKYVTRWDELQYFASISIEIATIFDPNGCDVYFLNRKPSPIRNLKSYSQLDKSYTDVPEKGYTPLVRTLNSVLNDNSNKNLGKKKLLIIIVTDGEPTNDAGKSDIDNFKRVLESRNDNCFTSIVACTDDEDSIDYLDKWDREIKNLDVVDDYRNEKDQISYAKGPNFPFSFGDYVVKSLLGPVDSELDKLDEGDYCFVKTW